MVCTQIEFLLSYKKKFAYNIFEIKLKVWFSMKFTCHFSGSIVYYNKRIELQLIQFLISFNSHLKWIINIVESFSIQSFKFRLQSSLILILLRIHTLILFRIQISIHLLIWFLLTFWFNFWLKFRFDIWSDLKLASISEIRFWFWFSVWFIFSLGLLFWFSKSIWISDLFFDSDSSSDLIFVSLSDSDFD